MRKSAVVASAVVLLIMVPAVTTFMVRRAITSNFSSKEGRKATDAAIAGLVTALGPQYSVTSAPALPQGFKVIFPSIKVQRQAQPWVEFTRTTLMFSLWPQLLTGKVGVKLEMHDALTQAAMDLSATPAVGLVLGGATAAESPTVFNVTGRDLKLRTLLEALNINSVGVGPLELPPDCCSAALNIAGQVTLADKDGSSAAVEIAVRYPRVKLPRRMGVLKFRDFALPLRYEQGSWLLDRQVEVVADDKSLTMTIIKAGAGDPLQLRIQGSSPLVKLVAVTGGCSANAARSNAALRLVWRNGQGWYCKS